MSEENNLVDRKWKFKNCKDDKPFRVMQWNILAEGKCLLSFLINVDF